MTALAVLAGIGVLVLLTVSDSMAHRILVLAPGVIVASVAVLAAGWLPVPDGQPLWLTALVPIAAAAAFVLVVAPFRRHGRSTSHRRR